MNGISLAVQNYMCITEKQWQVMVQVCLYIPALCLTAFRDCFNVRSNVDYVWITFTPNVATIAWPGWNQLRMEWPFRQRSRFRHEEVLLTSSDGLEKHCGTNSTFWKYGFYKCGFSKSAVKYTFTSRAHAIDISLEPIENDIRARYSSQFRGYRCGSDEEDNNNNEEGEKQCFFQNTIVGLN